ncbi:hypothetical protein AALA36_01395 [Lachnospiraceae bacterium 66-29]
MTNSGINFNQFNGYTDRWEKNKFSKKSAIPSRTFRDVAMQEERTLNQNTVQDKLESLKGQAALEEENSDLESFKQKEDSTEEENKTDTQILVRPDGSRVLLVKVMVAGMETTMSLKLSEATKMQNDSHSQEQESVQGSGEEHLEIAEMAEEMADGELK